MITSTIMFAAQMALDQLIEKYPTDYEGALMRIGIGPASLEATSLAILEPFLEKAMPDAAPEDVQDAKDTALNFVRMGFILGRISTAYVQTLSRGESEEIDTLMESLTDLRSYMSESELDAEADDIMSFGGPGLFEAIQSLMSEGDIERLPDDNDEDSAIEST